MAEWQAGKGTTALGVIGTTLGGLALAANGGLGILGNGLGMGYGGYNMFGDGAPVNRYELNMAQVIGDKNAEIAYLKAQDEVDKKLVNVYQNLDGRINNINSELRDIAVYQATNTATISCLGQQVNGIQAVLGSITKTVVPNTSVCPGWGDVTITPATTTTTPAG